jgi:MOSC domain-containing protein YiiM
MSELVSIVYKPKKAEAKEAGYTRVPLQETLLIADYGIEGDAKGGGKRQLNVMSAGVVQDLAVEGFLAEPGQLGEQLIVGGLDVDALPLGTRIRIGVEACVELTEPRTGCGKFERYQSKSPKEATGRLGMMARVVTGGPIAVGDPVDVVWGIAGQTIEPELSGRA